MRIAPAPIVQPGFFGVLEDVCNKAVEFVLGPDEMIEVFALPKLSRTQQ